VRDIVRGYWLLLEKGEPGEVSPCSGTSWPIQQVLDFLLGQSKVKGIGVKVDPARLFALGREIPRRRSGKVFQGHGVEGRDSLRAQRCGAPGLLAARTRASSR
jgi:hypothetical protein